jgi:hypothetical protein
MDVPVFYEYRNRYAAHSSTTTKNGTSAGGYPPFEVRRLGSRQCSGPSPRKLDPETQVRKRPLTSKFPPTKKPHPLSIENHQSSPFRTWYFCSAASTLVDISRLSCHLCNLLPVRVRSTGTTRTHLRTTIDTTTLCGVQVGCCPFIIHFHSTLT